MLAAHVLAVAAAALVLWWSSIPPRIDWSPAPVMDYPRCPTNTTDVTFVFGATSMLGRYTMETFARRSPETCLVSFSRQRCPRCHVNIHGDIRDSAHVSRAIEFFRPTTVLTSVKPPLMGVHYKTYIQVNLPVLSGRLHFLIFSVTLPGLETL